MPASVIFRYTSPLALLFALAFGATVKAGSAENNFEVDCAVQRTFSVSAAPLEARVEFAGRKLTLKRQSMAVGTYYRSNEAALITDGDFVAFVPKGDPGWRDCSVRR